MLVFIIDDEDYCIQEASELVKKEAKDARILGFSRGKAALEAIMQGERPDIVFADIEMPGISGLKLAVKIKESSPATRIVFVTGYEKYAVEAFRIKAHGYLLKPVRAEDIREELSYVPDRAKHADGRLVVRCFGRFDVFNGNEPVIFRRKKSKELLAYLIDRQGAACTGNEIAIALWENENNDKAEYNRLRVLINDLRSTLKEIGLEQVLIREHRELAVRTDLIDCDYYRMLAGDMDAVNSYQGRYMEEYSWAEITKAGLEFKR